MHPEVLSAKQVELFPYLKNFNRTFYLVGGTEKLFREQLAFHKDIDYSEPIEYLGTPIPENEIREFLVEKAIDLYN